MRLMWGFLLMVILGVPDTRIDCDAWVAGPSGGETTVTEDDLAWETTADSGNLADANGVPYAEPIITGDVSSATSYGVDVSVPGHVDRTGRYTITIGGTTYGANEPYVMGGVRTIAAVTSGSGYQEVRATATRDGRTHHVYADYSASPGLIRYSYRLPLTELDTGALTVITGSVAWSSSDLFPNPEIEVIESAGSGGYSLFIFAFDESDDGRQTMRVARSDDKGTTWVNYWSTLSRVYSVLSTTEALRVRYEPWSQTWRALVLVNAGGTRTLQTWVSRDAGAAGWSRVSSADIANVTDVDMVRVGPRFVMSTITSTDTSVRTYEAAGPTPGWSLANTETTATADSGGGLAMAVNPAGWIYRWTRSSADNDEILMQVSAGDSARAWGKPVGRYPYQDAGANIVVDDDADGTSTTLGNGLVIQGAAWAGEGGEVVGILKTSATTVDNSAVGMLFGGYSNLTTDAAPSGTDVPYYPTVIPETKSAQYHAFVTSGSTTQTIEKDGDGRLVYALNNDNSTGYDDYRVVGDPTVCGAVWAIGPDSAGGADSSDAVALWIKCHDAGNANNYGVALRLNTTTGAGQMYDLVAAANVTDGDFTYTPTVATEFMVILDGVTGNMSAYRRALGETAWTTIIEAASLTSTGGGLNSAVLFGKLAASTANIDTLYMIPFGSASDEYVAALAAGTSPLVPIRASALPQLLPDGARSILWERSPLMAGDGWDIATLSATPWKLTSPRSVSPSPTRRWVGTVGSSGAAYRAVFKYPTGGGRLSNGLAFMSWHNLGPISSILLRRWDGSAYQTEFDAVVTEAPFGASGATGWRRDTTSSLRFYPNAANATARFRYAEDLLNRWVLVADTSATNQIVGRINHVDPGQFSTTTGALRGSFSIDPTTYEAISGSLAGLGTSTSSGTIFLYPDAGMVLGTEKAHTDQYGAIEFALAPGIRRPTGGLLMLGAAYVLARSERDGSSYRQLARSELRAAPGGLVTPTRAGLRVTPRAYDLPYDTLIAQPGRYSDGTAAPSGSLGGTAYYPLDSNLDVIAHAHQVADQRMPVCLAIGPVDADPNSTETVFRPEQVMPAFLQAEVDRTMSTGLLRADGQGNTFGGRLFLSELT